jgi:SAM-dependent methyltransferase
MRNVIDETPSATQHGGTLYMRSFVPQEDIDGKELLDIGCGFGGFLWHALESGAASVTGVEPSEADLATASRHLAGPRVSLLAANAQNLPFEDSAFDTVTMWEVLEHIPSGTEPDAFSGIARVLRPGGRFFLSTPNASVVARVTDPAWWLTRHRHYAPEDVTRFAESAGLEVERIEVRGGAWQIAYMTNLYISKWLLRRPMLLREPLVRRLDREWFAGPGFTNVFMRCTKRA